MTHLWGWVSILGIALALAACAPVSDPRQPPPGSSPGFSACYAPGCAAGSSAADATPPKPQSARDEVRTRTDPDYRNGWDRGHAACFAAEQGAPHVGSMIIFWDPN
jgi:hypothetical protein